LKRVFFDLFPIHKLIKRQGVARRLRYILSQ
jgi:hypothetical protein